MKFSIVIPAYNIGNLVAKAISSCLAQKDIGREDYEIIVVDDGSTDETPKYIAKFGNEVRCIRKENGGLSSARNCGIETARGEYILFLDGDDWLEENALSTLLPHLTPKQIILFGYHLCTGESKMQTLLFDIEENCYDSLDLLERVFKKRKFFVVSAPLKCYPRELFTEGGLRFIDGMLHEDAPFLAQAVRTCEKVYYIDAPLYNYRVGREGSITTSCKLKNLTDLLRTNEIIAQTLPNTPGTNLWMLAHLLYCFKMPFKNKQARSEVLSEARLWYCKKHVWNLLKKSMFAPEISLRAALFLIDPALLLFVNHLLEKRRRG